MIENYLILRNTFETFIEPQSAIENLFGEIPNSLFKIVYSLLSAEIDAEDETNIIPILNIDLGSECNLSCKYCYARQENKKLDVEKFDLKLLDDLADFINKFYTNSGHLRVNFLGTGEPFLKKEKIKKIIESIEKTFKGKRKVSYWICTNGTIPFSEFLKELVEYDIRIGVSLEGSKELQNELRTSKKYMKTGTYDLIKENIQAVYENTELSVKVKDVWGLNVAHGKSQDLYETLLFARDLGIKRMQIKPVRDANFANLYEHIERVFTEMAIRLLKDIENKNTKIIKMILNDIDYLGKFIIRIMLNEKVDYRCGAGKHMFSIASDGRIYSCDSMIGFSERCLGNLNECDKIINKKEFAAIQSYCMHNDSDCNNCLVKHICGGKCYYLDIISDTAQKYECKLKQHLISLAIVLVDRINQNKNIREDIYSFCSVMRRIRKNGN